MSEEIEIKGARVNNLKNISISLPRNNFIVVSGVSGSGKSSFAFDTLYSEGRRRYVESLSAYARQFLGRIPKPECDYIKGLPPAIAIEQKTGSKNPRSTVGTATEVYDYLRMLYARIGHTISPISHKEVKRQVPGDVVKEILTLDEGLRIAILAPIHIPENRSFEQQLEVYIKEGYTRLEKDGEFLEIVDLLNQKMPLHSTYYNLLIDRLSVNNDKDTESRMTDSVETAYYEGHGECIVKIWDGSEPRSVAFSQSFSLDGIEFREPSDLMFNFNNPYGACEECEGFGSVMGISEDLVIPDKALSVYQGAIKCFNGEKMGEWLIHLINVAPNINFPIHKPYYQLSSKEKSILWHGSGELWPGIDGFFKWVDEQQYKIQYRVLKARYRGRTICPVCGGSRLKPDVEYVKINDKSITQLLNLPIKDLKKFFEEIKLSDIDKRIAKRLLTEIKNRLSYLDEVGLGYLTLSRQWNTLSGGESQRIKLATSLGSSLVGSLYVLDEPSIGLHPSDTQRLISVLKNLKALGNTLVVVEHDEEIMRASDYLVDIGPNAGSNGGEIVFSGPLNLNKIQDMAAVAPESKTLAYLSNKAKIDIPKIRRPWKKSIKVEGAIENNLKNIGVTFPLGIITAVTGVSGSGKSTLVNNILYRGLQTQLFEPAEKPGAYKSISGDLSSIENIEYVDQNPVGTSSRSNAATYLKIYDEIRRLYADMQLSRQMSYTPSYFSFNTDGGRCEECKGEGYITIPMQFMADIQVPCEVCNGKRFKQEILEVKYRGKDISDILTMTVDEAYTFFSEDKENSFTPQITKRLKLLLDVGLGYLPLGQPSSSLSGGENQRLKLASFLSESNRKHTLFILDEPTTGLHTADISILMQTLSKLVTKGNSVIIIEHNLHVIKLADWIIDLGPKGGEAGGELVAEGTPEQIIRNPLSITGQYLKKEMGG